MNTKPAHVVRTPDAAGRRVCSRRKAVAVLGAEAGELVGGAYAPGFFLALVRQHNWPHGFESRWTASRSSAPQAEAARLNRAAGVGHGGIDLGLPGAAEHIKRWRLQSAVSS